MRLLIQRVKNASVSVGGVELSRIGQGLLVLVGVGVEDTDEDMEYLAGKLVRLRIFDDGQGVMNLDVRQAGGEVLVVSQFTLQASTRKGNRPSYIRAAPEARFASDVRTFHGPCGRAAGPGGADGGVRRRHAGGAGERRSGDHLDRFQNEGLLTEK